MCLLKHTIVPALVWYLSTSRNPCRVSTYLKVRVNPRLRWRKFRSVLKWLLFALLSLLNFSISFFFLSSNLILKQTVVPFTRQLDIVALLSAVQEWEIHWALQHIISVTPLCDKLSLQLCDLERSSGFLCITDLEALFNSTPRLTLNALQSATWKPRHRNWQLFPLPTADGSSGSLSVCR